MKHTPLIHRMILLLLPATLLASACSSSKVPLYHVEGKVLFNDKPAHGAIVWLHPVQASDSSIPKPRGKTSQDGTFRLGTFDSKDGAPAGRYYVSVYWNAETKAGDIDGKNLLPTRYQDPRKSGLPIVDIKEGTNQLPAFQLTR
jgi:hypothetical protein